MSAILSILGAFGLLTLAVSLIGRLAQRLFGPERDDAYWRETFSEALDRKDARIDGLERENAEFREAAAALLSEMRSYYFHADDPELEAVNRLRRLLGIREQLAKGAGEAEVQAEEAEAGTSPFRAERGMHER